MSCYLRRFLNMFPLGKSPILQRYYKKQFAPAEIRISYPGYVCRLRYSRRPGMARGQTFIFVLYGILVTFGLFGFKQAVAGMINPDFGLRERHRPVLGPKGWRPCFGFSIHMQNLTGKITFCKWGIDMVVIVYAKVIARIL